MLRDKLREDNGQLIFMFLVISFSAIFVMTSVFNTMSISAFGMIFTLGTLLYTFGKTGLDVIQEFWGRKARKRVIVLSIILRIVLFFITLFAIKYGTIVPNSEKFITGVTRLMFMGMIILFLSQYLIDPWIYSWTAKVFKGKHPFIRGIVSNTGSTIITSPLQAYLFYYGVKSIEELNKIAIGDMFGKFPLSFFVSACGAGVIYIIRNYVGLKSLKDTNGIDHN